MIEILGARRLLTLGILILVNLALGGLAYLVLTPQAQKTENELSTVKSSIQGKRTEISTMQTEYELIQEQKNLFGDLEKSEFFSTQDRVKARRMIEAIQSTSKVLSARYAIGAAEVVENPLAASADHVLLHSTITVSVDALDDLDIYSFIYWMENGFPGHAAVTDLVIERKIDVDEASLRQIGSGIPTVLVTANISFDWSTMVPRANVPQQLGQSPTPPQ